jgi:hypothetical protein
MAKHPIVPTTEVALKFLALVERSRANIIELGDTGRWKHYYTEPEFLARSHELTRLRDMWAEIAGLGRSGLPALRCDGADAPEREPAET